MQSQGALRDCRPVRMFVPGPTAQRLDAGNQAYRFEAREWLRTRKPESAADTFGSHELTDILNSVRPAKGPRSRMIPRALI